MNYKRYKKNLILIIFIILVGCSCKTVNNEIENEMSSSIVEQKQDKTKKVEKEITISAVGDILIHDRVYHDAKVEVGYDFSPMLKQVKDYLSDATITFANQETMIGGASLGLSGYPTFNSPHEIGDALKEVGVNVISLSNNHTLDRGKKAVQSAIAYWEEIDMMYVGAYKDQLDRMIYE